MKEKNSHSTLYYIKYKDLYFCYLGSEYPAFRRYKEYSSDSLSNIILMIDRIKTYEKCTIQDDNSMMKVEHMPLDLSIEKEVLYSKIEPVSLEEVETEKLIIKFKNQVTKISSRNVNLKTIKELISYFEEKIEV